MYFLNSLLLLICVTGVFGEGEVTFLSKPPNIEFRGHEETDSGIVKDICSTSLGFTSYQTNDFSGLYLTSPFNFAEAIVAVAIHGVPSLEIANGHKFPFLADTPMDDIWATLESKIVERYPYSDNQSLVEINLEDGSKAAELNLNKGSLELQDLSVSSLKKDEDEDASFIEQIKLWRAILKKVEEKGVPVDGLPDLYWINLRGLHPIVDIYGENSNTAVEAKQLVAATIQQTKEVFDQAYQNKTLFLVLTSDTAHTRRVRRALPSDEVAMDRNLAATYDENYPVFFNIFLWFTIAFIMALIAISMVTATMDPGRDSIIYRMTSTRMKKDN